MEYNCVSKEKIVAARYEDNLNELFVLRNGPRNKYIIDDPITLYIIVLKLGIKSFYTH